MHNTNKKVHSPKSAAPAVVQLVPSTRPAANSPAYGGGASVLGLAPAPRRGRPVGSNTGRSEVVHKIHAAFAAELRMPVATIANYNRAINSRHSWPPTNLDSLAIANVMDRLASTLPHQSCGLPANVPAAQRAYAAGLIDGEGCISVVKTPPRPGREREDMRARFQVGQSDQQALVRLKAVLGAHGYLKPVKHTIAVNKQPFTLIYDGVHAIHALVAVYPYLRIKSNQAEALMRFWFDGRLWKFGPGVAPSVIAWRRYWYQRLRSMK